MDERRIYWTLPNKIRRMPAKRSMNRIMIERQKSQLNDKNPELSRYRNRVKDYGVPFVKLQQSCGIWP